MQRLRPLIVYPKSRYSAMLTKEFKESVWRKCVKSPRIRGLIKKAKESGLMDENKNWGGKSVEQTLFLVLLMQHYFDYNHSWEDEMPWVELGFLFNIPRNHKAFSSFARLMSSNYQQLNRIYQQEREERYSIIYRLFA